MPTAPTSPCRNRDDRQEAPVRDRLLILNRCPQCAGTETTYRGRRDQGRRLRYLCRDCGLAFSVSLVPAPKPAMDGA
jgi:hypothetical protein